METSEETTIVVADRSVLVNLAIVDRLDLLGALRRFRFRVPEDVVAEVQRPNQRELLERALRDEHLHRASLTGIEALDRYRRLRHDIGLGRGEAACLALALIEGWALACDVPEKGVFRREARELLGEGRLVNTQDLFLLAIREDYWNPSEADRAKEALERKRNRMAIRSFPQLMRRKAP